MSLVTYNFERHKIRWISTQKSLSQKVARAGKQTSKCSHEWCDAQKQSDWMLQKLV